MISSVIIKPTKECNADCSYCSAPPDGNEKWSIDTFKKIFARLEPALSKDCFLIWHGGEPMLMGPDFYRAAREIVDSFGRKDIRFSIQTNLLLYKSALWKDVFSNIFKGSVSTSFDPDEVSRTIKGSSEKYSKQFYKKIEEVISDGFTPMVIGTYSEKTIKYAHKAYDHSLSFGNNSYDIRFNYRYPAGRDADIGESITPRQYGEMLIDLWNRWITEVPNFNITPLDQMLNKVLGLESGRCPWTRSCGGKILGIEPGGEVYNCSEFADMDRPEFSFGNIINGSIPLPGKNVVNFYKKPKDEDLVRKMLSSEPARKMRSRVYNLPPDCKSCQHFAECEGGCMRDAELFNRGLGGKFYYCESWMMVFTKIKQDLKDGKVDKLLESRGIRPKEIYVTKHQKMEY